MMKKIVSILLLAALLLSLAACSKDLGPATKLSFAGANSIEEMKKLDGKVVSINGYMSTLSPISGAFMYLLNLPYQSCPFCEPNSTTLSNTLAIYAPEGKKFEFTDRLIQVTGILEFGNYTDEYGYQYSYRIKDATYEVVDTSQMDANLQLWQSLASTDVISDVYAIYDYINFLCFWGTYTATFSEGKDYLYPSDLDRFLYKDGAQFNKFYKDGYFEGLIQRIEEVDKTAFADLVANVRQAEAMAQEVLADIAAEKYERVAEYSGQFKDGRYQWRMTDAESYQTRLQDLYRGFANWLSLWEV